MEIRDDQDLAGQSKVTSGPLNYHNWLLILDFYERSYTEFSVFSIKQDVGLNYCFSYTPLRDRKGPFLVDDLTKLIPGGLNYVSNRSWELSQKQAPLFS